MHQALRQSQPKPSDRTWFRASILIIGFGWILSCPASWGAEEFSGVTAGSETLTGPVTTPVLTVMVMARREPDREILSRVRREVNATRDRRRMGLAWERFETEFGINETRPAGWKRNLESMKYALDKFTFGIDHFMGEIDDAMSLRFSNGRWRAETDTGPVGFREAEPQASERQSFLDDARFKVNLRTKGIKPYLEMRLVIGFGP